MFNARGMNTVFVAILGLILVLMTGCGSNPQDEMMANNFQISGTLKELGFGRVEATAAAKVSSTSGGRVTLADGATLKVPGDNLGTDSEMSLIRSRPPKHLGKFEPVSDLYFGVSNPRTRADSGLLLEIPFDQQRVRDGRPQAYAVIEELVVYPVDARFDDSKGMATITNPKVSALEPPSEVISVSGFAPRLSPTFLKQFSGPLPRVGYFLGIRPPLSLFPMECQQGEPGEVLEEPGHSFRIVFLVNGNCVLARFASSALQEALSLYNRDYADAAGNAPLGHFTPKNRMNVYVIGDGPNGEYKALSVSGYININVGLAVKDLDGLRETLFHELFHGVQDQYFNNFGYLIAALADSRSSVWWIEATAQWAGLKALGLTLESASSREISTQQLVLSTHIKDTDFLTAYSYSLLIAHVERTSPNYLIEAFQNRNFTSDGLYADMVLAGNLGATYPDFIRAVLVSQAKSQHWLKADIQDVLNTTRVTRRPGPLTEGDEEQRHLTKAIERIGPHFFVHSITPLTTYYFAVRVNSGQKDVEIHLTREGRPSDNAWIYPVGAGNAPFQIPANGHVFENLEVATQQLLIAVYNANPERIQEYILTIKLGGDGSSPQKIESPIKFRSVNALKTASGEALIIGEVENTGDQVVKMESILRVPKSGGGCLQGSASSYIPFLDPGDRSPLRFSWTAKCSFGPIENKGDHLRLPDSELRIGEIKNVSRAVDEESYEVETSHMTILDYSPETTPIARNYVVRGHITNKGNRPVPGGKGEWL